MSQCNQRLEGVQQNGHHTCDAHGRRRATVFSERFRRVSKTRPRHLDAKHSHLQLRDARAARRRGESVLRVSHRSKKQLDVSRIRMGEMHRCCGKNNSFGRPTYVLRMLRRHATRSCCPISLRVSSVHEVVGENETVLGRECSIQAFLCERLGRAFSVQSGRGGAEEVLARTVCILFTGSDHLLEVTFTSNRSGILLANKALSLAPGDQNTNPKPHIWFAAGLVAFFNSTTPISRLPSKGDGF